MNENMNTIARIPTQVLDEIAELIHKSNRVILTGFGDFQYPALYFQKEMFNLGKLVEVIGQSHDLHSPIELDQDDLLIITSVHGRFLKLTNTPLDQMNCQKVLITEIKNQEVLNCFDHYLRCGIHDDETLRKYSIMRIYEKIILHYYNLYYHKVAE